MEWTELKPPTEGESYYDHVKCETPLGTAIIEWKSWKEQPSYDVQLKNDWIGCEHSLNGAKEIVKNYLENKNKELSELLNSQPKGIK